MNDSMNPAGRAQGSPRPHRRGYLGVEALGRVVRHPALAGLPFVLETPNELEGYAREIALLEGAERGMMLRVSRWSSRR